MIKFALLTPSLAQPGGAERTILIQLRYSDPARVQCTGIALMGRGGLDDGLGRELLRYTTIHSDVPTSTVFWRRAPLVAATYPTLNDAVKYVCRAADVLIGWGALGMGGYAADVDIPVVCVAHSSTDNLTHITGITHLAAVSEAAKQYFANSPGAAGLPIAVIPNGVEVDRVCPRRGRAWQREQWGVSADDKVLLYLGRQAWDKNPWASIMTIAKLPSCYKLVMIGNQAFSPDQPLPRLMDLVAGLGVQDRVKFLPPVAYVGDALAGADCLMHLSLHEADSLVVKEAFLAGLPVVHTPVGSIPEMEAEFGAVGCRVNFQPGPRGGDSVDPQEAAGKVVMAMSGEARERAAKMRAIAWDHWTAPAMCERWAAYLEGVVGT